MHLCRSISVVCSGLLSVLFASPELRLGAVDVSTVAGGVDERIDRTLRGITREKLPVAAPLSRVRRNPYVSGNAAQDLKGALKVGLVSGIL